VTKKQSLKKQISRKRKRKSKKSLRQGSDSGGSDYGGGTFEARKQGGGRTSARLRANEEFRRNFVVVSDKKNHLVVKEGDHACEGLGPHMAHEANCFEVTTEAGYVR
jgi:hypothetical protein